MLNKTILKLTSILCSLGLRRVKFFLFLPTSVWSLILALSPIYGKENFQTPKLPAAITILQKNGEVKMALSEKNDTLEMVNTHQGEFKFKWNEEQYDIFNSTHVLWMGTNQIKIIDGIVRIRWSKLESMTVVTPVGSVTIKAGDYKLAYDSKRVTMEVESFEGSAVVQGQYREEQMIVSKGEKGSFDGILGPDGPAFESLLEGRKAIRGALNGPHPISAENLKADGDQYSIVIRPPVKKVVLKPKPGQICKAPFAKFNECVFRCLNNPKGVKECQVSHPQVTCVRERCMADGQWKDKTTLFGVSKSECKSPTESVRSCD